MKASRDLPSPCAPLVLAALTVLVAFAPVTANAAITERVSVSTSGEPGTSDYAMFSHPSISADGRFVAFASDAGNLVPGDGPGSRDVFVRDRLTGTTERVNVSSSGEPANGFTCREEGAGSSISGDGRFVAFESEATNLVPDDTNGPGTDIFVRDLLTQTTERIGWTPTMECGMAYHNPSISADGRYVAFAGEYEFVYHPPTCACCIYNILVHDRQTGQTTYLGGDYSPAISGDGRFIAYWQDGYPDQLYVYDRDAGTKQPVGVASANSAGGGPSLSMDGRYVAYSSSAPEAAGDANSKWDVFVRDRVAGTVEIASLSITGQQGNGDSYGASISLDGRFVAFVSEANNLVPGDTNDYRDVFLRDRQTGTTERITVAWNGMEPDNHCAWTTAISGDGACVAFQSWASNLVPEDSGVSLDVFVRDRQTAAPLRLWISRGAPCTNSRSVSLSLTSDQCAQVQFRNDPGEWGPWEAFAPTKAWMLPAGDGVKRVCVQGRDAAMNPCGDVCDEILLDTTPPQGIAITINGGALCAESHDVTLTLTGPGASQMRFREAEWPWRGWEPFASAKAWTLLQGTGLKKVSVQFLDACGNASAVVSDTILVPTFDDVRCDSPYLAHVQALVSNGITGGCSASPPLYCPNANVTRAQMAAFICRAAGKIQFNRETPTFCDVPRLHSYYGWIERLADLPSWNGSPPTIGCTTSPCRKFCPDSPVCRDETAAFLVRATGRSAMPSCSGVFLDVPAGGWACAYIERLADAASWPGGAAVTSGCLCPAGAPAETKCYCPKANVSRGQMAVLLVKSFGITL